MSLLENKEKTQVITIHETNVHETINHQQYQSEYQYQTDHREIQTHPQQQQQKYTKQQTLYSILNFLFRKALRKPFQKIVYQYHQADSYESIELNTNNKLSFYQLQIIQENIRIAMTLHRQRLLVDGFLSIKMHYQWKVRVQKAYYCYQNLYRIHEELNSYEKRIKKQLLWSAFGRLYQNYGGQRLLKINLSKIDIISNDFTSRELEDFQPFFSERGKEIQVIHSYIIDQSNENSSSQRDSNMDYKFQKIDQIRLINPQQEVLVTKKYNQISRKKQFNMNKKGDYLRSQEIKRKPGNESTDGKNRVQKKVTSSHKAKRSEDKSNLNEKLIVTEKKEGIKYETGTTDNKPQVYLESGQSQHIYLIRDYHSKKKQPSNYVKIPVHSDDIKIVQIHTGRKKSSHHKATILKQSFQQIEQSICQNCKYCLLTRERKQIMKSVTQRLEFNNVSEAIRVQYSQK